MSTLAVIITLAVVILFLLNSITSVLFRLFTQGR